MCVRACVRACNHACPRGALKREFERTQSTADLNPPPEDGHDIYIYIYIYMGGTTISKV